MAHPALVPPCPPAASDPTRPTTPLLPLGAVMLAASFGSFAQTPPADAQRSLPQVVVKEKAEAPEGKDSVRATTSSIGKGTQQLRDIPQSVTVVTEKLIDDRNLDTVKDVLRNTAGISFLAAEGGEEDIRLRGFRWPPPGTSSWMACATPRSTTATLSTTTGSRCCAAPPPCCSAAAPPAARSTRSASCRAC